VHVPLTLPSFAVDWQRVRDAITPKTRLIMINSPHNPSGATLLEATSRRSPRSRAARRSSCCRDEVYEHIVFDGAPHESVLTHPELAARSFVVSSFGKTYHCTGWKVGYCIAPPALSAEFRKVHQYLTFCTFTPAQWALADVLEALPSHYLELPAFYQAKRDKFRALLKDTHFDLLAVGRRVFPVGGLLENLRNRMTSRSASGSCARKASRRFRCRRSTRRRPSAR
jgi:methionine aminotransferase